MSDLNEKYVRLVDAEDPAIVAYASFAKHDKQGIENEFGLMGYKVAPLKPSDTLSKIQANLMTEDFVDTVDRPQKLQGFEGDLSEFLTLSEEQEEELRARRATQTPMQQMRKPPSQKQPVQNVPNNYGFGTQPSPQPMISPKIVEFKDPVTGVEFRVEGDVAYRKDWVELDEDRPVKVFDLDHNDEDITKRCKVMVLDWVKVEAETEDSDVANEATDN